MREMSPRSLTTCAELAELAEELIRRAVRDVQGQGAYAREAWAWLMLPDEAASGPANGWELADACAVLGTEPELVRRALLKRGYAFPPQIRQGGQRAKIPGTIQCSACGVPVATPDIRMTRKCAACGGRLSPDYLCRRGLLPADFRTTRAPRRLHAQAAMRLLLARGPLPARYLLDQLQRSGFALAGIRRARDQLRPTIIRSRDGYTLWALP